MCVKAVMARDLNSKVRSVDRSVDCGVIHILSPQDAGLHKITLVYPEMLYELIGEELYVRLDRGLASNDSEEREAALKELRQALLTGPAFTTGFECSVGFGWKRGKAAEGNLQSTFLRAPDPKSVEVPEPGADWQRLKTAGDVTYAIPKLEQPKAAAQPGTL